MARVDITKKFFGMELVLKMSYGECGILEKYRNFYDEAQTFLGERIFSDYLRRFAYGLDASCYRYVPQLVVWAFCEEEIVKLLELAHRFHIALTFRAAGTSLSGQACSDSVLVVCKHGWKNIDLVFKDNVPVSIWCDCGVIGADANAALKPYGKKLGPDPATINSAMIGGIFSNNSSGMCCGTKQNTYQTIKSVRVILPDGFILDTSDEMSIKAFCDSHAEMVSELMSIRHEILNDESLCNFIKSKYKIKNTTGYGLNTFTDFSTIKDILNHIFIGAEGTLGFVSRVEYECVQDFRHKACALLFYKNLRDASAAVKILANNDDIVSAAEIMDYASLVSVQQIAGMPSEISRIQQGNCAILVQLESDDVELLQSNIRHITHQLLHVEHLFGIRFSFDSAEQASWWKVRKGILPHAAGMRASGSTVIVEDICFNIDDFADGIEGVSRLFKVYGFDGIIFGHVLSGNVHFIITPLLGKKSERKRFGTFMQALADLVVGFNGSIKAEHGTGRMVAPFVEQEWGDSYGFHRRIKSLFDKKNIINPDVIISDDTKIHLKNLKPSSENLIEDYLDACMECGFCEKICPSKNLSLTPRERIAVYREIERLKAMDRNDEEEWQLRELEKGYKYFGVQTCATCSMCATLCPLEIDVGTIAHKKSMKNDSHLAALAHNVKTTNKVLGFGVATVHGMQEVLGEQLVQNMSKKIHRFFKTPVVLDYFPTKNTYIRKNKPIANENGRVVYFSSCLNRIFAPSTKADDKRSIAEVFENLCLKAGFSLIYPKNLDNLCCSKAYKNYDTIANLLAKDAYTALLESSDDGMIPIVCDHSACSLELLRKMHSFAQKAQSKPLEIIDMPAFILHKLSPYLVFTQKTHAFGLYAPCSTRHLWGKSILDWEESLFKLAQLCGVCVSDDDIKCCGFAGDKGFFVPELNAKALEYFGHNVNGDYVFNGIMQGFSSSSSCEIGLSQKSGFAWQHIVYLVDSCSKAKINREITDISS